MAATNASKGGIGGFWIIPLTVTNTATASHAF